MYQFFIIIVLTFLNPKGTVEHNTIIERANFRNPIDCRFTAELLATQLRKSNTGAIAICQQVVSI